MSKKVTSQPYSNITESHTVVRGTGIVSLLTMVSRFLGFVRDLVIARVFGAGVLTDIFFAAFRIPNLLRSIVGEGALTSAFVPVFSSELSHGREAAQRALSSVAALLVIVTAMLSAIGIIFSPEIVKFFGFEGDPNQFGLCVLLTRIMMPYVIFISLVAMLNGALSAAHIYGASALAQVIMNLVLIVGALLAALFDASSGIIVLSVSVVVGGAVQVVFQAPFLARAGYSLKVWAGVITPATKQVLRLITPAIAGAAIYQITVFMGTVLASYLENGSVSWLYYADRLAQLPIGVFTIALASVLLPALSRAKASGDEAQFVKHLVNSLRYTSLLMIPVSCLLFYYAHPIIQILFEGGEFSSVSTANTAAALRAYAVGLWALSCHTMIIRAFIACKDTKTPSVIGLATLITSLFFSLYLMGPLAKAGDSDVQQWLVALRSSIGSLPFSASMGHVGLALSSSIAAFITFGLGAAVLNFRFSEMRWHEFAGATIKVSCSSLLMLGAAWSMDLVLKDPILSMTIGGGIATLVFVGVAWSLRMRELQEMTRLIKKMGSREDL